MIMQDVNCDASSVACKVLCRPGCVADDPSGRFQTRPHSGEECPAARISAPNTHRSMSRNSRKPRVTTAEGSFTSTVCCNILGLWKLYFLGFPEGTRFQQFMSCDKAAFTDIQIKSIALMALFQIPSCFNMFGSFWLQLHPRGSLCPNWQSVGVNEQTSSDFSHFLQSGSANLGHAEEMAW